MKTYDPALFYLAQGAMRARIESGVEFRIRQIWIIGNHEAGWGDLDDKSPCFAEAWNLVNEYRRRNCMKSRKAGQSRVWRYVG
jgi:hypothetical protein